jgi:hypothetical protein
MARSASAERETAKVAKSAKDCNGDLKAVSFLGVLCDFGGWILLDELSS